MGRFKIAFIHPDLGIGGAERLILDVALVLDEKKHEVEFVTNHFASSHAFEELKDDRFQIRVIGNFIPRSIFGLFQAMCAYLRMIYLAIVYLTFTKTEDKPDVYFVDQIPMAVPFIKWFGGKVVYYCHHPDLLASSPGGFLKKLYRSPIDWLEMKGTNMSDIILVNSKYTASVFKETFPQVTKNIKVLYPTISATCQKAIETGTAVSMSNLILEIQPCQNAVYFLSINRFHPAKSLDFALYGLKDLQSKVSSDDWKRIHLLLAGGFDPQNTANTVYFHKLIELAHKLEITDKVTFLKSPSDKLKAQMLLACDCLIYTPMNEHFGIVPLEAMSAGKPVIACKSGGPCETVEHGVTGYLCKPTAEDLANYMQKILDKNNTVKMGSLGKKRLELQFAHEHFANNVNTVVFNAVHSQTNFDLAMVEEKKKYSSDSSDSSVTEDDLVDVETQKIKNSLPEDHESKEDIQQILDHIKTPSETASDLGNDSYKSISDESINDT